MVHAEMQRPAPFPPPPPPFTLLSKICMHLLQCRTVKMLQFYITTPFCVDIDHFNTKCRKLLFFFCCCCLFVCLFVFCFFLFLLFFFVMFCCCCFFVVVVVVLHFANATCRNVYFFFFFFFFYIFTSCVVTYPTMRNHHFRQHLISNFHENHIPFFAFFCRFKYLGGSAWGIPRIIMKRAFDLPSISTI